MIQARLTSGEVINLPKDCDCVIHVGPHWLHMDEVDKRLNQPLRERALRGELLGFHAYEQEELRRLGQKFREMERQQIAEIIKDSQQ
jgi:hypothetical protein